MKISILMSIVSILLISVLCACCKHPDAAYFTMLGPFGGMHCHDNDNAACIDSVVIVDSTTSVTITNPPNPQPKPPKDDDPDKDKDEKGG